MAAASIRALLQGVIDYAGLFPPAQLPLDQAVAEYARHRRAPESWMLGRFVCPAARLTELAELIQGTGAAPWTVSALGRSGKDVPDFLNGLRADLADITAFRTKLSDQAEVDVYETRLPAALMDPAQDHRLHALIGTSAFLIETEGPPTLNLFLEAPTPSASTVEKCLGLLAADRQALETARRARCRSIGFKLRTGGLEAAAFPDSTLVAATLVRAGQAGVPLKFTAGLHHPFRHVDTGLRVTMHGFVNVFVAGIMALAFALTPQQVAVIVHDDDPGDFGFADDELGWKELRVATATVENARKKLATSFGSCSFDEPRDDLRKLGLLP